MKLTTKQKISVTQAAQEGQRPGGKASADFEKSADRFKVFIRTSFPGEYSFSPRVERERVIAFSGNYDEAATLTGLTREALKQAQGEAA